MKNAIIIMVKVPEPGHVKTRLQPFLSPEQSAGLAVALLGDAETKARNVTNNSIIAFSPPESEDRLKEILQHKHVLLAQRGGDLGERMHHAFDDAFKCGFDRIVMIGTDSPACRAEFIEAAFEKLETASDTVLGKAKDGGFYLIGLNQPETRVFKNVEWGSAFAFDQTKRNIESAGLRSSLLPVCADIDRAEDLQELASELSKNPELAPTTARWIADNMSEDFGKQIV